MYLVTIHKCCLQTLWSKVQCSAVQCSELQELLKLLQLLQLQLCEYPPGGALCWNGQHVQQEQKMRVVWQRATCGLLNIHVSCSRTPPISLFHVRGGHFTIQTTFERVLRIICFQLSAAPRQTHFRMKIKFTNIK